MTADGELVPAREVRPPMETRTQPPPMKATPTLSREEAGGGGLVPLPSFPGPGEPLARVSTPEPKTEPPLLVDDVLESVPDPERRTPSNASVSPEPLLIQKSVREPQRSAAFLADDLLADDLSVPPRVDVPAPEPEPVRTGTLSIDIDLEDEPLEVSEPIQTHEEKDFSLGLRPASLPRPEMLPDFGPNASDFDLPTDKITREPQPKPKPLTLEEMFPPLPEAVAPPAAQPKVIRGTAVAPPRDPSDGARSRPPSGPARRTGMLLRRPIKERNRGG